MKKAFAETDIYVSPALLKEYRVVPLTLESERKLTPIQLKALVSGLAAFVTRTIVVYPHKNYSSVGIQQIICCSNVAWNRKQTF